MNEHYSGILRRLYILRKIGDNGIVLEKILGPFAPSGDSKKAKLALEELKQLGLVISQTEDRISLNPDRYNDIIRLLDPEPDPIIQNIKPFEESIPKNYHRVPFLTTEGSHMVKGVIDTYSFHKNRSDPEDIVVFLLADYQKKNTIHLGKISDPKSLYRRALLGIEKKFGSRVFTKAMMNELGKEIVGNRQPPKALIDMMIHEGYVIPIDEKHFQRTVKPIPPEKGIKNFMSKENKKSLAVTTTQEKKLEKEEK